MTRNPAPALDPMVRKLVDAVGRSRAPDWSAIGAPAARALYEKTATLLDIAPAPLARVDDWTDGGRRVRRYCPQEPSLAALQPALLYCHGGGFTIGSIETHDRLCRSLARQSGAMVFSLDYRLAPEHRFPAAVDDAFQTLGWLRDAAISLGVDADRLAVGGDSAGGTLAAALAIHARDRGWPLALQLLIYPGLSARQDTASHRRFASGVLLDAPLIQWFFDGYVSSPADRDDWRFAPLVHPDLHGVAPAFIALAECDPLVDEGRAYAQRLRNAGVAVDLAIYPGMIHSFFQYGGMIPMARLAHRDAARAMTRALRPEPGLARPEAIDLD